LRLNEYKLSASRTAAGKRQRKRKGEHTFVIAPLSRQCHRRGAQVHCAQQAASDMPALDLSSRSRYSFYRPRKDGGLSRPRPRVQRATGPRLLRERDRPRPALDSNLRPRGRWSSTLTTSK